MAGAAPAVTLLPSRTRLQPGWKPAPLGICPYNVCRRQSSIAERWYMQVAAFRRIWVSRPSLLLMTGAAATRPNYAALPRAVSASLLSGVVGGIYGLSSQTKCDAAEAGTGGTAGRLLGCAYFALPPFVMGATFAAYSRPNILHAFGVYRAKYTH